MGKLDTEGFGAPRGWLETHRFAVSALLVVAGLLLLTTLDACTPSSGSKAAADKAHFHYQLANNYFYDHNIVMAMRELHTALELAPDHPEANHLQGFIYFGRMQYTDAITHFQRAIRAKPDFHDAIANLGAVYLAQKRWAEAAEQFEHLTREQLYPNPHLAHANLGWALYGMKRYPEALEHYRMALFLNPGMCLGHNNMGLVHEKLGDVEAALRSFERAVQRCPRYAEPHFHLGRLLAARGQMAKASEAFAKCYELEPESTIGRRCAARRL